MRLLLRCGLALVGLAVFSSLLGACARRSGSSDDSDSNNAGSSNAGSNNTDDGAACLDCNETACGTQLSACRADTACGEFYDCFIGCSFSDADCLLGCASDVSNATAETAQKTAAVQTCATQNCQAECTANVNVSDDTTADDTTSDDDVSGPDDDGSGDDSTSDDDTTDDTPQPPVAGLGFDTHDGGYVTVGPNVAGYAWTGVDSGSGSWISPSDFSSLSAGDSLCASGTVYATEDFSGVALLGFNVNQAWGDEDAPAGTWIPDGQVLNIQVSGTSTNGSRVQVQGPTGGTNPDARWCANILPGLNTIRFSDLNTECWVGGNGNAYAGEAIESIMVLIPGEDFDNVDFNICIDDVAIQ